MPVSGKTFRNCDECSKAKSCNIVTLRSINDKLKKSYTFYVCDDCLITLHDVGGTQKLVREIADL